MPAPSVALRSFAIPAVPGPTRLRLPDLLHITDQDADDVLSGRYDHLLPPGGVPAHQRWFTRLRRDDELDAWLISWVPGETTALHDHSGSLGALTLLSGALYESRWAGNELRRRRLGAGDQAAFPLGWVHDVTWAPSEVSTPTLSVHAYSPPLTAMSYYEVTARKTLRRVRTELTDSPEVLEWRCDPTSDARLPQAVDDDVDWVVLCSEGYTSSLAAAALQDLGLHRATDVVGGYWALHETGALAELTRAPSPPRAAAASSPASTPAAAGSPPTRSRRP